MKLIRLNLKVQLFSRNCLRTVPLSNFEGRFLKIHSTEIKSEYIFLYSKHLSIRIYIHF